MDQNEGKKWHMPWYDWSIFVVPGAFIIGLGLESALGSPTGPDGLAYRDFRAIAHWFDPVFFQYNLVMTLLTVLVVPSLAVSYIQTMSNRKEQRLQREVPAERRGEIRRRMGQRASFSTYRGSVWLTTTVVLLGTSILLLFKPISSAGGMGVDFSLGANMLTMGPFAELYRKKSGRILFSSYSKPDRFPVWFPGRICLFRRLRRPCILHNGSDLPHLRRWRHPHDRREHTGIGALLRLRLRFPYRA